MQFLKKRVLAGVAIAIGSFVLLIGLFFGAVNWAVDNMFGHEEPFVSLSPDGQHQALVFVGDSGATDHFHMWVSVLPKGKKLGKHDRGNAFGIREERPILTEWVDSTHLRVEYPMQFESDVHFKKSPVNGISIQYVGVP